MYRRVSILYRSILLLHFGVELRYGLYDRLKEAYTKQGLITYKLIST